MFVLGLGSISPLSIWVKAPIIIERLDVCQLMALIAGSAQLRAQNFAVRLWH